MLGHSMKIVSNGARTPTSSITVAVPNSVASRWKYNMCTIIIRESIKRNQNEKHLPVYIIMCFNRNQHVFFKKNMAHFLLSGVLTDLDNFMKLMYHFSSV